MTNQNKKREQLLEEALLEYVIRYGLSDKARRAFRPNEQTQNNDTFYEKRGQ